MDKATQLKAIARMAICASLIATINACGGSGSDDLEQQNIILADESVHASVTTPIASDAGTPEFTPSPGDGLPIQYQETDQDLSSNTEYIGLQWENMQTCLQVSAQEPTVVVVEGQLEPTDSNDDVVRHINGQIQASSHVTDSSATIQVRAEDFEGTLGLEGSFLRSIMGRYLWLANNLPERDYPYNCAKGE